MECSVLDELYELQSKDTVLTLHLDWLDPDFWLIL